MTTWHTVEDEQRMLTWRDHESTLVDAGGRPWSPVSEAVFELYVEDSSSAATERLAASVRSAIARRLASTSWRLEVVDVDSETTRAVAARVCQLPTLIRVFPTPRNRAIGITEEETSRQIGLLLGLDASYA